MWNWNHIRTGSATSLRRESSPPALQRAHSNRGCLHMKRTAVVEERCLIPRRSIFVLILACASTKVIYLCPSKNEKKKIAASLCASHPVSKDPRAYWGRAYASESKPHQFEALLRLGVPAATHESSPTSHLNRHKEWGG
ncbi:hypothetical protein B0H12DRAFT_236543 [Mycena haematopus]|nr:hypothetical protein B0H12DRAFT_236543 [Mycena haematopus]